ncbi:protein SMAX1-LIKE 7-like isoform X2 [Wolffia australiana]
MPTPVSTARQYLTAEAAAALDEAACVARRRSHVQTTSLHVVSALLSLPSSSSLLLRSALSRTRRAAREPRFQFKTLELCFSLALDLLPSAVAGAKNSARLAAHEPPVSNSLMAAIKRSHATQRRHPETLHLYQQYQRDPVSSSSSSSSLVMVELEQLVLSILDDPIVSRVFADAGFRSYDIKYAVLHSSLTLPRLPRAGWWTPLFLCNFSTAVADDICRMIGNVIVKGEHRSPLLIGPGAGEAVLDFESTVRRENWIVVPQEARGVKFINAEKYLFDFALGKRESERLDSVFRELSLCVAETARGLSPGTVVSFGSVELLVDLVEEDNGLERLGRAQSLLTKLKEDYREKLWLIGSARTYETYLKFLSLYPSIDKDWDLQILPFSSTNLGLENLGRKKNSLIESFVPVGGLVSVPLSSTSASQGQIHPVACNLRLEMNERELTARTDEFSASPIRSVYSAKATDDGPRLNTIIQDKRKKLKQNYSVNYALGRSDRRSNTLQETDCFLPNTNAGLRDALTLPLSASPVSTDLSLGSAQNFVPKITEAFGYGSSLQMIRYGDFKSLFNSVLEKVGRQEEAILSICDTICRCMNGNGRLRGSIWLSFLGPDKFGKRKVADALAEVLFGGRERLVCIDLSLKNGQLLPNTGMANLTRRGKTINDQIADEIRTKPGSVIFLESLDKADIMLRNSLSRAIKSGNFQDSGGGQVDTTNVVFITTMADLKDQGLFSEERILRTESRQMKILIDTYNGSLGFQGNALMRSGVFIGERKMSGIALGVQPNEPLASLKRANMDLNLHVTEMGTWRQEFLNAVDQTVNFRTFDFNVLADDIMKEIEMGIRSAAGFMFALEIEPRVMDQILAAAWMWERGHLKNWLQQVLVRSFIVAQRSYRLLASSVLKLVSFDDGGKDNEGSNGPVTLLPWSILPCELSCLNFLEVVRYMHLLQKCKRLRNSRTLGLSSVRHADISRQLKERKQHLKHHGFCKKNTALHEYARFS